MTRSGKLEGPWIPRPTLVLIILLAHFTSFFASADDFFLKASKSVPRIGRRAFGGSRAGGGVRTITADLDHGFFMKAAKSVPRIGRRRTAHPLALGGVAEGQDWGLAWPWYRSESGPGPSYAEIEPAWMTQRRSEEGGVEGEGFQWNEGISDRDAKLGGIGAVAGEGQEENIEEERVDEGERAARVKRFQPPGREGVQSDMAMR